MEDQLMENKMNDILKEISDERDRQVKKGYGTSFDDGQGLTNFCDTIIAYSTWAKQMMAMNSHQKYRKRMMQIAALAIAACESYDRKVDSKTKTYHYIGPDINGKYDLREMEIEIPVK